ncbi:FitA-like ribbon-helix-helix domain-containing protein [Desulfosudis oleivorans]|uniref:Antitoxin FitA-like ribbon-helix-helix domain-containing protein n=1 Tax=Desulfosudis oleivorans (strain DSM 6200 / JCM 39069 / Hxd3) TaxID=96561 RepID=A9A0Z0_DESOH|nr:toxin-antitoxin system HicB family antitoxin [Desulfosudis oleivorans]ABW67615.1 hypothetical protein Dole_1811 [Desulfosudis oleivorans Hxd3]
MNTVTIRGLDPDLLEKLKRTAAKQEKSLNQFTLDILRQSMGCSKGKKYSREYDDLDHLFGRWSADEFKKIQGAIDRARHIDEELWK